MAQVKNIAQESAFIKQELGGYTQTRAIVKVQVGENVKLVSGAPLHWDNAANAEDGAFVPYVSGTPRGKTAILISEIDATEAGLYEAVVLYRGPAVVSLSGVAFDPTATAQDKRDFIRYWLEYPAENVADAPLLTTGPAPVFIDE